MMANGSEGGPEVLQPEVVSIDRALATVDRQQQIKTAEAIAEAERRAELVKRVTEVAVRRTYPQDWIDFRASDGDKGTPYLSAAGAERLRTLFGISITGLEVKRYEERDKEGPFWFYIVLGVAHWRGDEVAVMGTCSSRDQFFRVRYQEGQRVELSAEEVDPTNIVKAARSNLIANAVTGILGLRGMTWEQLGTYGVERGKGGTATFQQRKPAAPAPVKPAASQKTDELRARLEALAFGDAAAQKAILVGVTAYPAGTKDGKVYKAFSGWNSVEQMIKHGRNPERTAAVALAKIEEMVQRGEIPASAAEPREGDHPGLEGARQPPAPTSIADEDAQPPPEATE